MLTAAAAAPWSMKPLLGFLADSVVIGGYSKRYWIILVTLPSIVACAVFGVFGAEVLGPDAIAALVFVMALQFAMIDLLSEAEYARKLQQNAEHGPGLMSFVWAGVFVSSLLSTTISGAMLEWAAAKWAVLAALPFIATPIVPAVLNWLGEARHFEKRAEGGRDGNVDATRVLLLGGSEGAGDAATTGVAAMGERDAEGESTEKDESEDEEEDAVHRTAAAEGTRVVAASFDILLPPASPAGAPSSASGSAAGSRGRCAACCDCFRRNVCAVDCAKARSQRKLFTLSLGMGVLAIVTTAMQTFGNDVSIANVLPCDGEADAEAGPSIACRCGDEIGQIVESVIVGALVLVGFWAFTPPPVAKVQTFFFVQNVFTISIEGGAFYFFTDDATAFPDGPHFSNAFYVTAIGVVSNLFALVGIWSYNSLMHNWKYRTILLVANLAFMLVNVVSAAVYLRWNRIVGIPDDAFVIGRSVLLLPLFFISFLCHTVIYYLLFYHLAAVYIPGRRVCHRQRRLRRGDVPVDVYAERRHHVAALPARRRSDDVRTPRGLLQLRPAARVECRQLLALHARRAADGGSGRVCAVRQSVDRGAHQRPFAVRSAPSAARPHTGRAADGRLARRRGKRCGKRGARGREAARVYVGRAAPRRRYVVLLQRGEGEQATRGERRRRRCEQRGAVVRRVAGRRRRRLSASGLHSVHAQNKTHSVESTVHRALSRPLAARTLSSWTSTSRRYCGWEAIGATLYSSSAVVAT